MDTVNLSAYKSVSPGKSSIYNRLITILLKKVIWISPTENPDSIFSERKFTTFFATNVCTKLLCRAMKAVAITMPTHNKMIRNILITFLITLHPLFCYTKKRKKFNIIYMSIAILGIESSCDDTAAAVIEDGFILSSKIAGQEVHRQFGGVVPELASRAHQQNIIPVVEMG
jgi:hypothetical protein